ncbi:MAG: hypothetical protein AAFN93_06575 [Bacteroidota bacterium]
MKHILLAVLTALATDIIAQKLPLSTQSDSAQYYYYLGWEKVMDDGDYTGSANAFRKMASHDDQFLVGLTLLGRISDDLDEQKGIKEKVESEKNELPKDERRLLDVFNELLELMIVRISDPDQAGGQIKIALDLGEQNFRYISNRYPDDIYYKCEYIEILNYNHGPKIALDSLYTLASKDERDLPFLLGYAAMMEADLGNYELATKKAKQLQENLKSKRVPKPHVVWADIYLKMGKMEEAKKHVEMALEIDPGNIDAQRLSARIDK